MLLLCIVLKYPSAHTLLGPMLLVMSYPHSVQFSVHIYYTNWFTEQEMIQPVQASAQATLNFGQLWAKGLFINYVILFETFSDPRPPYVI